MRVALLVIYLWSAGALLNVQVPFTESGAAALYGSDAFGALGLLVVFWALWRQRRNLPRTLSLFVVSYLSFFTFCLVVLLVRLGSGIHDMQSLVIPRANLSGSVILIVIVLGFFSAQELMLAAYIFATTLSVVAGPLALYDIYLPFSVFENLAIRTDIQLFLMPILLIGLLKRNFFKLGSVATWLFAIDLASLLFVSVVSGARVNAMYRYLPSRQ